MTNTEHTFELIFKHFPNLSIEQQEQIKALAPLYAEWNDKINVISRKDIDKIYLHHVLHSLAIAKFIEENIDTESKLKIMDLGTGGGFPGIPLAIIFPNFEFLLVDSIGKKIKVVQEVSSNLGLKNVRAIKARAEEVKEDFDYIISRAVTDLSNFLPWVKGKYKKGIIYLKGGDISKGGQLALELDNALVKNKISSKNISIYDINLWFKYDFFNEKKVIFIW